MRLNTGSRAICGQIRIVLVFVAITAITGLAQDPTSNPSPTPLPTANVPEGNPDATKTTPENTPPPVPPDGASSKPSSSLEKSFIGNIFRDQRAIFTSPFHLHGSDAKYLLPLGLATGGLIATDRRTSNELIDEGGSPNRVRISNNISRIGAFYGVSGIAGTMYLFGRATHSDRLRETGLLGAEAIIDGGIVSTVLKTATQRTRPNFDNGRGDFLDGGASFPSGHATVSWALASVVAHEYKDNRLISYGAYGVAALVSVSRFTGRNHFLSDVLVGSAIGYGVGRYVYRNHHDPALDSAGNDSGKTAWLIPSIIPSYSRSTSSYGLKLSWGL